NPCADNICYGGIGVDAGGKTTGKFVPDLGALIHEKNSDPTQFINFKYIGMHS
ncbi:hypothetical protein Tco_1331039, partial [Tanacetum coccineum]